MSLKTYHGGCHCGAVRFECDIDLAAGTARCNCSFCTKNRTWNVIIKPQAFRLLSGEDEISDYQFGTNAGHHLFCKHCGIRSFERGHLEQIGGDYVSVTVTCLDDATVDDLMSGPVTFANGRDNAWWNVPADVRHL